MEGGKHDVEEASSNNEFKIRVAKIDTLFMTKPPEKPYSLKSYIPIQLINGQQPEFKGSFPWNVLSYFDW